MQPKNTKIAVLSKMVKDKNQHGDSNYIVPANSAANVIANGGQKSDLCSKQYTPQPNSTSVGGASEPIHYPLRVHPAQHPAYSQCPHCENMAKNFLYLESLIRENSNNKRHCAVCDSSLKYLQYVNRSIMQVLGNFDEIAKASSVFTDSLKKPSSKKGASHTKRGHGMRNKRMHKSIMSMTIGGHPRRLAGGANKTSILRRQKSATFKKHHRSKKNKGLKKISSSKNGKSREQIKAKKLMLSRIPANQRMPKKNQPAAKKSKSKSKSKSKRAAKDKPKIIIKRLPIIKKKIIYPSTSK